MVYKKGIQLKNLIKYLRQAKRTIDFFQGTTKWPLNIPVQKIEQENLKISSFLFSASSGLFLFDNNKILKICDERCFGITKKDNFFYFTTSPEKYSYPSMIYRVNEDFNNCVLEKVFFTAADLHQIDFFENRFYVTDTKNNRILVCHQGKWVSLYPAGKIEKRHSKNYAHFNSLFITKEHTYILAHNDTIHSKRNSQIYSLRNKNFEIEKIIDSGASCAHDLVFHDHKFYFSDSMGSKFMIGDKAYLDTKGFLTRGFAYNGTTALVGGSAIADRENRGKLGSAIFIIQKNEEVSQINLQPSFGQIYEIMFINNEKTLSMSEFIDLPSKR